MASDLQRRKVAVDFGAMVFLVFVCLLPGDKPLWAWTDDPRQVVLATACAMLAIAVHAYWVSRRVVRKAIRSETSSL